MPELTDNDVTAVLRSKGPLVVNDIRKSLKADSMIVGATLSSLLSKQAVKVTHLKKGSSPFYYTPGQEPLLEKHIELHNPKDQQAIQLLRTKQVLRDRDLELIHRVGLRQVKDFAKEVKAQVPGGTILFWRYYLLTENQAIELIKERYWHTKKPEQKQEVQQVASVAPQHKPDVPVHEEVAEQPVEDMVQQAMQEAIAEPEPAKEEPKPKSVQPRPKPLTPKPVAKKEVEEEKPAKPLTAVKSTPDKPLKPIATKPKKEQQTLSDEVTPISGSPFYDAVSEYFTSQEIIIEEQEQISKDREYGFVVTVPSAVGELKMYCRARNKKKLNEGDVAPSVLKAKQLDIPCLFLTNGSFTKKSLATIEKDYNGVILQYLE